MQSENVAASYPAWRGLRSSITVFFQILNYLSETSLLLNFVFLLRDCDGSQINYLYAQYVRNTMLPLNIADVTKDQRFPWMVCTPLYLSFLFLSFPLGNPFFVVWQGENSNHTRDQIKSLLCTPIRNGKKDKVIGVDLYVFLILNYN